MTIVETIIGRSQREADQWTALDGHIDKPLTCAYSLFSGGKRTKGSAFQTVSAMYRVSVSHMAAHIRGSQTSPATRCNLFHDLMFFPIVRTPDVHKNTSFCLMPIRQKVVLSYFI